MGECTACLEGREDPRIFTAELYLYFIYPKCGKLFYWGNVEINSFSLIVLVLFQEKLERYSRDNSVIYSLEFLFVG